MKIRPATTADAAAIVAIYAPYVEQTVITFDLEVPTVESYQTKIQMIQQTHPFFVAESAGEVVGYAYASSYYGRAAYVQTAEISLYIRQTERQSGVGTCLYQTLETALREQGVQTLLSCLAYPNDASEQFHLKHGFHRVGHFEKVGYKFGQWHDTIWLQKHIGNFEQKSWQSK